VDLLLYIGSVIILLWGIAHIIATRPIVNGFDSISEDNRKILIMEVAAEGVTLCFIGLLVLLVTALAGSGSQAALIVYIASAVMLLAIAALTTLTGARTSVLPYKLCPVIKTMVAILFILGSLL